MGEYFDHHRGLSLTLCNAMSIWDKCSTLACDLRDSWIVEQLSSIVHVSRTGFGQRARMCSSLSSLGSRDYTAV